MVWSQHSSELSSPVTREPTRTVSITVSRHAWRKDRTTCDVVALDACHAQSPLFDEPESTYEIVGWVIDPMTYYGPGSEFIVQYLFAPKDRKA